MCTFLGIAGKISPDDINENFIKQSELVFLEGYLWDEGEPKAAFDKALALANNSAMSLSDKFCVDRHKKSFYDLVKNKLDIIFANEQEIMELIDAKSFNDVIEFGKNLNKTLVITRSDKGSIAIKGPEIVECEGQKNLKLVDLTGAGDLFASGFLHGFINKMSTKDSLQKGTEMASRIIQKIGARLN
jgi:fructokinase